MFHKKLLTYVFLFFCISTNYAQDQNLAKVDMLIFSFNRPLQLYALLESISQYVTGLGQLRVIYRASDATFESGYNVVQQKFATVTYIRQGDNPQQDFKPLTIQNLQSMHSPYIIFAVDDMMVKDYVDFSECASMLEETGAYGFYLRLGMHTNHCYAYNSGQGVPQHQQVCGNVYAWRFAGSAGDWVYPHTVDMTIFRKADVLHYLNHIHFTAPNSLEGEWAGMAGGIMNRIGLFYETSKVINLPLNRVQHDYANRQMNFMTSDELQSKFEQGYKIDLKPLFQMKNRSAHMDYEPAFITR